MSNQFFPKRPEANPTIYAYKIPNTPNRAGLLKIGFTTRGAEERIKEQLQTSGLPYNIVLIESAMRNDGSSFTDHDIHRRLKAKGFKNTDGEWFKCKVKDVKIAIKEVLTGILNEENRNLDFKMRPEQEDAVNKTIQYFESFKKEPENKNNTPRFLWNAKMRYGKTFTSYQLAKKQGWSKILVLTFKPAVQSAWKEDLLTHIDFEGWQFISNSQDDLSYEDANKTKPFVCFGSFQDFLGKNTSTGGIKTKNEWVHATNWDCVIFDEYHYGAWRDNAKDLFEAEEKENDIELGDVKEFDEDILPITTDAFLYLSGTPFRAITSGEFIEEQIFNWTYSDEQKAKEDWKGENNPYESLPRMVMLTYQMPDSIREIALGGEFNEFDLNLFFKAKGEGENASFVLEDDVQKWLDLIRGSFRETTLDSLKMGAKKPPMPFSDSRLLNILTHTFWFLPSVASCHAMKNLMTKKNNTFYHDYDIVVAAGTSAGIGVEALPPVLNAMDNPLETKTITLSCGKLTTGVTVKPWAGIFMLRNSSSP